jgi:UPF0755 protein
MGRRSARARRKLFLPILITFLSVGLIGSSLVALNYDAVRAQILKLATLDYSGPGVGEVVVRIDVGDDGYMVAEKLLEAGVIRDVQSFYRLLLDENAVFYPGSFMLKSQMSNRSALEVLSNPANAARYKITIPEGYRAVQIFEELSRLSGIPVADFFAAAEDLAGLGIPADSPTVEGYLFPATYSFDKDATAKSIIEAMVDRMKEELVRFGVAEADWHRVLTIASIIQREAKLEQDFYKVSRVFENRLAINMILQTDPTISYSYSGKDMSKESRDVQIDHGYNTYLVKGLPPGPISSPGSLSIDATLNPAPGDWLYFVTINLASGETKFTKTYAEHKVYVDVLREWQRQNPN